MIAAIVEGYGYSYLILILMEKAYGVHPAGEDYYGIFHRLNYKFLLCSMTMVIVLRKRLVYY